MTSRQTPSLQAPLAQSGAPSQAPPIGHGVALRPHDPGGGTLASAPASSVPGVSSEPDGHPVKTKKPAATRPRRKNAFIDCSLSRIRTARAERVVAVGNVAGHVLGPVAAVVERARMEIGRAH